MFELTSSLSKCALARRAGPELRPARRAAPSRPAGRRLAVVAPRAAVSLGQGMSVVAFDEKLKNASAPAVLVDFCTTWCGPCKVLDRNIKAIEKSYKGRVEFVKVDTEENPEVADHFGVHKLPTLVLFQNGQQVDRCEGLLSGQDLDMRLRKLLM